MAEGDFFAKLKSGGVKLLLHIPRKGPFYLNLTLWAFWLIRAFLDPWASLNFPLAVFYGFMVSMSYLTLKIPVKRRNGSEGPR